MTNEIGKLFEDSVRGLGVDLRKAGRDLQLYVAGRVAHLATLVGQAGYQEAVEAEARNVALEAAISAVTQADATDQRIVGIIQGVLSYGAVALAAA